MGGGKSSNPRNTAQERAASDVALQRYQRYREVYQPLENAAFADVTGDVAAQHVERQAMSRVSGDSAKALDSAAKSMTFNPYGTAGKVAAIDPERAAIVAQAATDAAGLGRKQKMTGLQAAVDIGSGQASDAQLGFDNLAGDSLRRNLQRVEDNYNANTTRANTWGAGAGVFADSYRESQRGSGDSGGGGGAIR